jgi:hypothetical protein
MYGMARKYMRDAADATGSSWSIQDGVAQMVPLGGYLPGEAVALTAESGLIGQPEQTNEGIKVRSLLNPRLRVGGRIKLDNRSILRFRTDLKVGAFNKARGSRRSTDPAVIQATHGQDCYSDLTSGYRRLPPIGPNSSTGGEVMDRRGRSMIGGAVRAALTRLARGRTALPGVVAGFDPVAMTVSVQPAIKGRVTSPDGSTRSVALPLLVDVPVFFPRGGGFTLTFPVKSGDECLVVFSSRCMDAWWQSGG